MSLVRLHNASKSYGKTQVIREVFFRLDEGERVGLIGKNGTGKTTVFRLVLGQEELSEGTVEVQDGVTLGYFSQFSELDDQLSVLEILDGLFEEVHTVQRALRRVSAALEKGPEGRELDRLLHRQAELFERMDRLEGWTYTNKIDTVLARLGFNEAHRTRPASQLSGGWRNRAALAKILIESPQVLLLDEPTNYLDIDGLSWLEEWLRQFRGAAAIVSHDRDFLDHVVTRIVEIENYHFQEYSGDFTQYVRLRQTHLKSLERQFQHEAELLAFDAEAIADRKEAAENPTRSLRRRLANIRKAVEPRPVDRVVTRLYQNLRLPKAPLRTEAIGKAFGDEVLFRELTFEVQRGDRFCIVGPNGCGKTTLIRALTGDEEVDTGRILWYKAASFVDYNKVVAELDLKDTVSHAVNVVGIAFPARRWDVNRFLELMRFSEMDLRQPIGTLSAGQRARVALAICLVSGASVVILDEPTNHLDITATQVMERALANFPGAVIVATHDRFFIDKVATRLLVFAGSGRVKEVSGNWTIWQTSLRESAEVD